MTSKDCAEIREKVWEYWTQMHDAENEADYHQFGTLAFWAMSSYLHHCPEEANKQLNYFFGRIRKMKPGPYLQKSFKEAVPELFRDMV